MGKVGRPAGYRLTEEAKDRIGAPKRGKPRSPEVREKIREGHRRRRERERVERYLEQIRITLDIDVWSIEQLMERGLTDEEMQILEGVA